MLKRYSIDNMEEFLSIIGHLKEYLRVYDKKDIILFNSGSRGDSKMLSNFYPSSVPLPWRGKQFRSVEAMIFYAYIEDNCDNPEWQADKEKLLDFILNSYSGKDVHDYKLRREFFKKVREAAIFRIGKENWELYSWKVACEAIKVKYDYCPEFRKFVDANKDKYFCEDSYWKKKPKAGVLKVTDKNSPLFGKYIGANYTGIAIQRCLTL